MKRRATQIWSSAPCTIAATALALGLGALPARAAALEYERQANAGGEVWRLLSAHVAHFSGSHLAWNALGFGVLGALCERSDRRRFAWAVALSGVAIPAALWSLEPELASYRGLSGLTSALFGLLAAQLIRAQLAAGERRAALLSTVFTVGFVAVLARTWLAGEALLVTGFGSQVAPVPLSHAVGLAIGVAVAFLPKETRTCVPPSVPRLSPS